MLVEIARASKTNSLRTFAPVCLSDQGGANWRALPPTTMRLPSGNVSWCLARDLLLFIWFIMTRHSVAPKNRLDVRTAETDVFLKEEWGLERLKLDWSMKQRLIDQLKIGHVLFYREIPLPNTCMQMKLWTCQHGDGPANNPGLWWGSNEWLLVFPPLWPEKIWQGDQDCLFCWRRFRNTAKLLGFPCLAGRSWSLCFCRTKSAVRSHLPMMCHFAKLPDSSLSFLPAPATWHIERTGRLCKFWRETMHQQWDLRLAKWISFRNQSNVSDLSK